MMLEEEYVILKYIELLWTYAGHIPEKYLDILAKYNVNSIIDLDKVVHKIHRVIERKRDKLREAEGDIEYIEYLLETIFQSRIVSSKGSGVSEPGYIETEHLNCFINLISPVSAEILIETDYEVNVLEFADDCLNDFKDEYFENDVKVVFENNSLRLISENIDPLIETIHLIGESILADDIEIRGNEVVLVNIENRDEALKIIEEAYNSYIAFEYFITDTDRTVYKPIYLERAYKALNRLAVELQDIVNMKIESNEIAKIHLHEKYVHLHGKVRIHVETVNSVLLPFVIAGVISSIDTNGTEEEKHFTSNALRIAKLIKHLWRQSKPKEVVEEKVMV